MAAAKFKGLAVLGEVADAAMDLDTDLSLFTVPVGKVAIVVMVLVSECSADLNTSVVSFGASDGKTNFLGNQTIGTNCDAANSAVVCQPIPHATPVEIQTYVAGEVFVMDRVTAGDGATTATITVFGFLRDA